eukprot:TRINITY_DN14312_c0_g1_i1.p1 TRINITY_DN14312_c0_g1~~TRINITY_DN14312_c0_g1_i1.p1  ORF type:complete len:680 (+),score=169.32 TRINITY_DN14312_c0_g1_i1:98-2137(+)
MCIRDRLKPSSTSGQSNSRLTQLEELKKKYVANEDWLRAAEVKKQIAALQAMPQNTPPPSVQPATSSAGSDNAEREGQLHKLFAEFDLDGSGTIEIAELQSLGQARRSLGQKKSAWTAEQNAQLLARMDTNADGRVNRAEFAKFLGESLPSDMGEFGAYVQEFVMAAQEAKEATVLAEEEPPAPEPEAPEPPPAPEPKAAAVAGPSREQRLRELEALKQKHADAEQYQQVEEMQRQIDELTALPQDAPLPPVATPVTPQLSPPPSSEPVTSPGSPHTPVRFRRGSSGSPKTPKTPAGTRRKNSLGGEASVQAELKEMKLGAAHPTPVREVVAPIRPQPVRAKTGHPDDERVQRLKLELIEALGAGAENVVASKVRALAAKMQEVKDNDSEQLDYYVQAAIYYMQNNPADHVTIDLAPSKVRDSGENVTTVVNAIGGDKYRSLQLRTQAAMMLPDSIRHLTALSVLNLSSCPRLAALPNCLGELSALTDLNLSGCLTLGCLPDTIGQLRALEKLQLSGCAVLTELPSSMAQLTALTELHMSFCSQLRTLPEELGNLPALTCLDMSYCTSLTALPDSLQDLSSVTKLDLGNCTCLERLPPNMEQMQALSELNLANCTALAALPKKIGNIKPLTELDLSFCQSLAALPASTAHLKLNICYCSKLTPTTVPDSMAHLLKFAQM